jgi:N-acetylneuraminic acid mutarotase
MLSCAVVFKAARLRAAALAAALLAGIGGCQQDTGSPTGPEPLPSFALASNTWTEKAPKPGTPLEAMSAAHFPNSAGQSLVYLIGGAFRPGDEPVQTGFNISVYNAATNTWEVRSGTRVDAYSTNGVGAIGNKLYFSGGYIGEEDAIFPIFTRHLWAYDVVTGELVQKADMPKATAEGVTGAIDGRLYVLAGQCDSDRRGEGASCEFQDTRRLFRYNPATNTWATRQSAPHVHRSGAAGVIDGKLYVAGGLTNSGRRAVADLDVYDPATNTWKTLAPMPVGGAAIGTVLGGKLFVVTGSNAYLYNPRTNTWSTRAAPEFDHDAIVRVRIDGGPFLLAVGGVQGEPPGDVTSNPTELYTP